MSLFPNGFDLLTRVRIGSIDSVPIRVQNTYVTATNMPAINVRVDQKLWSDLTAQKPEFLSDTAYLNLVIYHAIDNSNRLDGATEPASGPLTLGRSPSNSSLNKRNKEKDISDISLRAEEAHVSEQTIKSPPRPTKELPGNLVAHDDLIKVYWKAKPKNKSVSAWKLLMTELTKIQDDHGDIAVRSQLEQAEANKWQSITLANYEKFGLPQANTPKQGSGVDWDALEKMGPMF
jgi:hypothetical protein